MKILATTQQLPCINFIDVCTHLYMLDKNNITRAGMTCMPDCRLVSLVKLHLSNNNIGSTGAKLLIKADLPVI